MPATGDTVPTGHHDDAQQIEAKREARAAKKRLLANAPKAAPWERQPFLRAEVKKCHSSNAKGASFTLLTWNTLAQNLIRRKLFPNSDCLKWSQRNLLLGQMLFYQPSVAVLQEVDRIDEHGPVLREAGYDFVYDKGYESKKHGLCIAWKRDLYTPAGEKCVFRFDEASDLRSGKSGLSRKTRNIGLVVSLKSKDTAPCAIANNHHGLIVATHHLFWHAKWRYERSSQLALWLQFLQAYRAEYFERRGWPITLAGDFNFQPNEVSYALLASGGKTELLPAAELARMRADWEESCVIHAGIDAMKDLLKGNNDSKTAVGDDEEDEEDDEGSEGEEDVASKMAGTKLSDEHSGELSTQVAEGQLENSAKYANHPDRVLHNCRPATSEDGLLTWDELTELYKSNGSYFSAYDRCYDLVAPAGCLYKSRRAPTTGSENTRLPGDNEPSATNVTALWHCTLDYIFVSPGKMGDVTVTDLLQVPSLSELQPGLPRLGVCASDHVPLLAGFSFDARKEAVPAVNDSAMKYGKEYEALLASNANYQQWSSASIRYKALKKIITNVANELNDVGLDAAVLRELFANNSAAANGTNSALDDDRNESKGSASSKATMPPMQSYLNATAEYEVGGTSEEPRPRIKIVFASDSGSSDDGLTDADLLKRLQNNLLAKKSASDDCGHDDSQSQSGEDRFDELDDNAEADVKGSARAEDVVLPRSDSKLMLRMYGFGVAPAHESTPPGSPDTLRQPCSANTTPRGSMIMMPKKRRDSSPPRLVLPKASKAYPKHANDDADDEGERPQKANGHLTVRRRRPRRTVYVPLKTDTQFFGLLAQAIDSLQKLEIAQKEEFARRVDELSQRISRCASPGKSKADMYSWREIFSIWIEAEIFESSRERDRGERPLSEATKRLHWFVDEVGRRKLARKFKLAESRVALQQFLDLNESLLSLRRFIEANEEAARKILKKHDKRTALSASTEFPHFRATARLADGRNDGQHSENKALQTTSKLVRNQPETTATHLLMLGAESLPHVLLSTFTEKLLPIIPQLDDFACLICGDVAYRPIRLDCGHKFCLRCLVKMQRRRQDACPHCRALVVLKADQVNLDVALEQFLELYFPKEVRKKAKENSKESTKELFESGEAHSCVVM